MTTADFSAGARQAVWQTAGMAWRDEAGIPVRVLTWAKGGPRVRFRDGRIERVHPDDVHTN